MRVLALTLMVLAAEPVYVDPYAGKTKVWETPAEPVESPTHFQQTGFTGSVGALVPLSGRGQLGISGGVGVRYAMRPPEPSQSAYFSPAISFRIGGELLTTTRQLGGDSPSPLGGSLTAGGPATYGAVGADVRLELTVSRRGGHLMPDFATWLSTGTSVGSDGERWFPTAHVGFGLGIDFVRDVAPALGKALFSPEAWSRVNWGGLGNLNLGGGDPKGMAILAVVLVLLPIIIVAGMVLVFVGGSMTSMANVELRYTAMPMDKGIGGYGGLVIGFVGSPGTELEFAL